MAKHIVVDIEADGPCPGIYSMVSLGAVLFEDQSKTFYGEMCRMPNTASDPKALAVSGFTEDDVRNFRDPSVVMKEFDDWIKEVAGADRVRFVADNAGFDWQFVNYYFHKYLRTNPFGFSPVSMTWLYKGFSRTSKANFKHLRKTKHTHNALDDARGNAEALQAIIEKGFKL